MNVHPDIQRLTEELEKVANDPEANIDNVYQIGLEADVTRLNYAMASAHTDLESALKMCTELTESHIELHRSIHRQRFTMELLVVSVLGLAGLEIARGFGWL